MGKTVDVYVYKWVGQTDAAIWFSNLTMSTYREKLIFKTLSNLNLETKEKFMIIEL